jgi:hypothetical protein
VSTTTNGPRISRRRAARASLPPLAAALPAKLLKPESPPWRDACDVDNQGYIRWRKHKLFISSALAGETVELECIGNWTWQIRFLDLIIADLDDRKLDRGCRWLLKTVLRPPEVRWRAVASRCARPGRYPALPSSLHAITPPRVHDSTQEPLRPDRKKRHQLDIASEFPR